MGKVKCVFFMSPDSHGSGNVQQYLLREKLATEISISHLTLVRLGIDKTIFIKQRTNLFYRSPYPHAIFSR